MAFAKNKPCSVRYLLIFSELSIHFVKLQDTPIYANLKCDDEQTGELNSEVPVPSF